MFILKISRYLNAKKALQKHELLDLQDKPNLQWINHFIIR